MRRLPDLDFFVPPAALRKRRMEVVDAAVAATHHTLVVTHAKCLDGVGSYLIHALAEEAPPPVIYAQPGEVHEVLERVARVPGAGKTLSVNDLSFDRGNTEAVFSALMMLKDQGWTVVWRDHHHKQWEGVDTDRVEQLVDVFRLDREQKECGTSLAQADLLPDDSLAIELAAIIRDRDLWWNKDPRSARFEFALRHIGTAAFVDRFLSTRDVNAAWLNKAADEATKRTEEEVETAILSAEIFGDHGEVGFLYGEVPKNVTLHTLRERRGTRLEISMKPDGRFSVRSAKGTDVAHLLGQAYGGGGHPNAAGGKAKVAMWEWPSFWLQGGMSPAGKSVVKTALRLIATLDAQDPPPTSGSDQTRSSGAKASASPKASGGASARASAKSKTSNKPATGKNSSAKVGAGRASKGRGKSASKPTSGTPPPDAIWDDSESGAPPKVAETA